MSTPYRTIPKEYATKIEVSFENEKLSFDYGCKIGEDIKDWLLRFDADALHVKSKLNEKFCRELLTHFRTSQSTADKIIFENNSEIEDSCLPETFYQFLEISNANLLQLDGVTPVKFLQRLPKNILSLVANSPVGDEELLGCSGFGVLNLQGTWVTSSGLNAYIKDTLEKQSMLVVMDVTTRHSFKKNVILEGIPFSQGTKKNDFIVKMGEVGFTIRINEEAGVFRCFNNDIISSFG